MKPSNRKLTYRISRKNLYDSDSQESSDDEQVYLPKMEFEFVEVEQDEESKKQETKEKELEANEEEDEQFAFPLFTGMASGSTDLMTVSLKEEEEEVIVNERPETYYRAIYTETEKAEFSQAALTTEQIFADLALPPIDAWPLKVLNVEIHNAQVEREKKKRSRPGKKKREHKAECRERRQKREKERKKERAAQYKKRFVGGKPKGQWGSKGRGDKPGKRQAPKPEAPKFRTE